MSDLPPPPPPPPAPTPGGPGWPGWGPAPPPYGALYPPYGAPDSPYEGPLPAPDGAVSPPPASGHRLPRWALAAAIAAGIVLAAGAGWGTYLLATRPGPKPIGSTHSPSPSPPVSAPALPSAGEPAIQPGVDCSGGTPGDAYMAAATRDICQVLVAVAAIDPSCAGNPETACVSTARALNQAAGAALSDIEAQHPITAGERSADPHLRAAFQDYAGAGDELSRGVAGSDAALERQGMTDLSAGTNALSIAGVDLSG